jgi:hypothetical protein
MFTPFPRNTLTHAPWAQRIVSLALLSGAALVGAPALAAGQVELNFLDSDRYADIGVGNFDRERNLRDLQAHFDRLGQRLPAGQTLKVDVLDVDLAGELRPNRADEMRVMRGGVDWPSMKLRYTLTADGTTLAQGEDQLTDPGYMFTRRGLMEYRSLPYEGRMLNQWFSKTFDHQVSAVR